jgi:hypothetical protein
MLATAKAVDACLRSHEGKVFERVEGTRYPGRWRVREA